MFLLIVLKVQPRSHNEFILYQPCFFLSNLPTRVLKQLLYFSALAQCRINIPLFHRAAYRIAQAFNWAPAFHDPDCDFSLGSTRSVPATKSYRIRGLNTGSCAESAAFVMGTLFEKRR